MPLSSNALGGHYTNALQTLSEIAEAYYAQGRFEDAFHLWQTSEQLLAMPEISSASQLQFLLHYGIFLVYYYYLTNKEEPLMLSVVQRAQQAADALQNKPGIATGLFLVGQALYFHCLLTGSDEYEKVRDYFQQACALQESIGEDYELSESLFYTGLTYDRQGQSAPAQKHYLRSLELAEQQGNKWAASEATRHLTDHSEGEERLRYALRSLELRVEMDLKRAFPPAQLLISDIYVDQGELELALKYCQEAEQLATEMHLQDMLTFAQMTYGEIARKQDKLSEAREHFHKALELAQQFKSGYAISAASEKLQSLDEKY